MNAVEKIALFDNLFFVFVGLAIVGLIFAVFFFFFFDIPKVFSLITGRNRKQALEQMQDRSVSGKSLRSRGDTSTQLKRPAQPLAESGELTATDLTPLRDQPAAPPDVTDETVLLNNTVETTVLTEEKPDAVYDKPDTTVLNPSMRSRPMREEEGATALLTRRESNQDLSGLNFSITEEILFIHTDEVI